MEKVVNSRTVSRKEKRLAIDRFLKENTGKKKEVSPEEAAIIDTLKTVKKGFLMKDKSEKQERTSLF